MFVFRSKITKLGGIIYFLKKDINPFGTDDFWRALSQVATSLTFQTSPR